jgi:hypothetical protein
MAIPATVNFLRVLSAQSIAGNARSPIFSNGRSVCFVIMCFQKMFGEWTRNATLSRDARLDFQEIAVSRDLRIDA